MKRLILLISITLLFGQLIAQAPQGINYQAVARNNDANNTPMANMALTVGIKIKDAFGTDLYTESHNVTTNVLGLFNLTIGQGSNPSTPFSNLNWASGSKLLEVFIDGQSGGTQPLLSVPYALYAERTNLQAGNGISVSGNIISSSPDIAIFEERQNSGVGGGTSTDNTYNVRRLNTLVKASSSVSLNANNNRLTFQAGTYVITASAPAYKTDAHRLCLRQIDNISNPIVLVGTGERSLTLTAGEIVVSRSFINGVLTVANNGTIYELVHYTEQNSGGASSLGGPAQLPGNNTWETYAQIVIQKVQ